MGTILTKHFAIHKKGCCPDEYEDALSINDNIMTFSIADGATEATFSKEWADILVEKYTSNPVDSITSEWLMDCYRVFNELISKKSLPWHAQLKLESQGAFSTIAGLQLDHYNNSYQILTIGDSCIFWNDSEGIHLFPYKTVEEFENRPYLLCSIPYNNIESLEHQGVLANNFSVGKTKFYLLTDALSCWFIREHIKGNTPWKELDNIAGQADFEYFVEKLRENKQIRNDDVTLIIVEYNTCGEGNSNGISNDERL